MNALKRLEVRLLDPTGRIVSVWRGDLGSENAMGPYTCSYTSADCGELPQPNAYRCLCGLGGIAEAALGLGLGVHVITTAVDQSEQRLRADNIRKLYA